MDGEQISRDTLNQIIDGITWYHINPYGELVEGAHGDSDALFKAEDIFNAIDNAPTVEPDMEFAKVDTDELLKKLNDSIGATMGEQIPRWLWEGVVTEFKNERLQKGGVE